MRCMRLVAVGLLAGLAALPAGAAARVRTTIVYIHDRSTTPGVHAYRVDSDGVMTALAGSPFVSNDPFLDGQGQLGTMAYDAKAGVILTTGAKGVASFKISADGSLARQPGSPFGGAGLDLVGISVVRRGKHAFVYAADHAGSTVRGFELAQDGQLTELPPTGAATGLGARYLGVGGGKLFAANQDDDSISPFVVASDGHLTAPAAGAEPVGTTTVFQAAAEPKGKFVYAGSTDANGAIFAFKTVAKTGALSPVAGSPFFAGLANAAAGVLVPSQARVFAFRIAGNGSADCRMLKRQGSGALVAAGNIQSTGLADIRVYGSDAKGKWLFCASPSEVRSFSVNAKTGGLTPLDHKTLGATNPTAMVVVTR